MQLKVDYIGAYRVREWHGKALRHLRWWGYFTLLCSLLSYVMALMCCKSLHFMSIERDLGQIRKVI